MFSSDNADVKFPKDLCRGFTSICLKSGEDAIKSGVTGLVQGTLQGIARAYILHQMSGLGRRSLSVWRPLSKLKLVQNGKLIAETHYKLTLLILSAKTLGLDKSCGPICAAVRVEGVDVMKTAV
ncbi:unnamed protein product [Peronospora effusa]|uniref:Uncharacterized protein n=1 Tax=Peronospora effusa TaxID=542832 RepID=A0A3M6VPQ4_9STRA|nr:hypothetical protein DD238_008397 [Peronospora effusa]CAI5707668.1 unnamed protein product [Peronospora effusa]